MSLYRSLITALCTTTLAAAALLWTGAVAVAATAPVVADPGQLASGRPAFAWSAGPAGERVSSISISPSDVLAPDGGVTWSAGGRQVEVAAGATSARVRVPMHAGTWWWTAAWQSAATDPAPASGHTDVRSFVIPARLGAMRGRYVQVDTSPMMQVRGSLSSNLRAVMVTCSVHAGRTTVARTRTKIRPKTTRRTGFACPRLRVSERLDGRRLALRVVARGGGKRSIAISRFRAT